jgi:TolB protein
MMSTRLAVLALFLASVSITGFSGDSQKSGGHDVNSAGISIPAPPPSPKKLREIIALSKQNHSALLGGMWLVNDGQLKDLTFPQPLLYPSPATFFDDRRTLLYTYGEPTAASGALALLDLNTGQYRDIASFSSQQPHAPAPSPDKQHVAFVNAWNRLAIVDLQTQKVREIAPASDSTPSWSPDGKYIVFEKNRERDPGWSSSEVAIVSLDSGNVTVLDKGRFPSWSPKGDLIAYTDVDGKQLKVSDPQGGHRRILKKNLAAIMGPIEGPLVWSPDQMKLIFERVHESLSGTGHTKIYLLDISTGETKALVKDEIILAWR